MKVTNISGSTLTFNAGKRSYTIDNNASATLDDENETLNDVVEHIQKGRLQIVTLPPSAQYVGTPERYGYAEIKLEAALADEDTLTIAGVIFEIDEAADGVEGAGIAVTAADATDNSVTAAGLKSAINANATLSALGLSITDVVNVSADDSRIILKATGDYAIADVAISESGGFSVTKINSQDSSGFRQSAVEFTATADTALVDTGLASVNATFISVRTAAGAEKAYDGAATIGGGFVYLDNSGDVDIAATDVIFIQAIGK